MSNLPTSEGPLNSPAPAAAKLQILATEHWSLLATRSMTYTESFSRIGMSFTVLTGAIISLALLAQVEHFNQAFAGMALLIPSVVFFVGVATLGRLAALNKEDARWVAGMNRLRHAYLDMHPELDRYFITDSHDDMKEVFITMGFMASNPGSRTIADMTHGFTTLPAMLVIIIAVVGGVLGALVAGILGASEWIAIAMGAVVAIVTIAIASVLTQRAFFRFIRTLETRFPSNA